MSSLPVHVVGVPAVLATPLALEPATHTLFGISDGRGHLIFRQRRALIPRAPCSGAPIGPEDPCTTPPTGGTTPSRDVA